MASKWNSFSDFNFGTLALLSSMENSNPHQLSVANLISLLWLWGWVFNLSAIKCPPKHQASSHEGKKMATHMTDKHFDGVDWWRVRQAHISAVLDHLWYMSLRLHRRIYHIWRSTVHKWRSGSVSCGSCGSGTTSHWELPLDNRDGLIDKI